jgi:hypothetical protein
LGSCTCPHILGLSRGAHGGDRGRSRAPCSEGCAREHAVVCIKDTGDEKQGVRCTDDGTYSFPGRIASLEGPRSQEFRSPDAFGQVVPRVP